MVPSSVLKDFELFIFIKIPPESHQNPPESWKQELSSSEKKTIRGGKEMLERQY